MRTLYFTIGGTGYWDSASNWSLADGGVGGEPIPTSIDDVLFTDNSINCTLAADAVCNKLTTTLTTNLTHTISLGNYNLTVTDAVSLDKGIFLSGNCTITANSFYSLNSTVNFSTTTIIEINDGGSFSSLGAPGCSGGELRISSGTLRMHLGGSGSSILSKIVRRNDVYNNLTLLSNIRAVALEIKGKMNFGNFNLYIDSLLVTSNGEITGCTGNSIYVRNAVISPGAICSFGTAIWIIGKLSIGPVPGDVVIDFGGQTVYSIISSRDTTIIKFSGAFASTYFRALHGHQLLFDTTSQYYFGSLDLCGHNTDPIIIDTISGTGLAKFNCTTAQKVYYVNVSRNNASYGLAIINYNGTLTSTTNWTLVTLEAPTTVAKSVGSNGIFSSGTITVLDSTHLILEGSTFSTRWGEGDKLTLDGEIRYVFQRISSNQITLQQPTSKTGSGLTYTIQRAYANPEAACIAEAKDLISSNETLKIVIYTDGSGGQIRYGLRSNYGWRTDYLRFPLITAALLDRHTGVKGTGASVASGIYVENVDYVEVSWLEVDGGYTSYASYPKIHHNIIYNATYGLFFGIGEGNEYALAYRNIIYDCDNGIFAGPSIVAIEKHSIYDNTIYDCDVGSFNWLCSCVSYKNNLIVGCTKNWYFGDLGGTPGTPVWVDSYNNIGETADQTALTIPGPPSTITTASNEFKSITSGSEDLHLKAGAVAIAYGAVLSSPYDVDIDNEQLSPLIPWDVGADQAVVPTAQCALIGVSLMTRQSLSEAGNGRW